jgi:hypothetical protein
MALKSYLTYKLLREMAAPGRGMLRGTVSHLPIQYDKDDILFLRQFDTKKWPEAIEARYNMLHDALVELQKSRDAMAGIKRTSSGTEIIKGGLADNIKKFLMDSSSELDEEIKKEVAKRHTFKSGKPAWPLIPGVTDAFWSEKTPKDKVTEKDVEEIAEDDAFEIAKKKTENLDDAINLPKGKVEFKIGVGTVRAFPYLNRLYHKLERTRGETHHPSSGLEGSGEHGFDLSHPAKKEVEEETEEGKKVKKSKKTTRGLSWVAKLTWDKSLRGSAATSSSSFRAGYLAHSAYNHFGDLKETPAYKRAEEAGTLKWLPMDGKEGRTKVKDPKIDWLVEAEVKKIKDECEKQAHEAGVKKCQKTPKDIKKEAEQSVSAMVERGEVYAHPVPGIPDEDRKYRLEGGEPNVQYIYLPHQKVILPKESPDEPSVEKYVPILRKSSTLLKKRVHDYEPTSIEEDPEAIETGERTGVVNVGPTPNRNEPAQAFADPRVASNYHLNEFLKSLLVSDYEIKRGMRVSGVIPDFIIGIKGTLQGSARSGGTSPQVQRMIRNDPEKIIELHNMVYNFILAKHLASKKLQTEDGRRRLAQSIVSSYLQGTEFEIPRRSRGKGGDIRGYGDVAAGEEGAEYDPSSADAIKGERGRRKRGEAIFSKSLQQIRNDLSQMEKRIAEKETIKPKIERGESFENSKSKIDQIMQGVKEKTEFFEILRNGLIEEIKMTEKQADDLIKSWQEAESDPNRPEWTLDRVKEAFMGMLQSAKKGEEMQVVMPEPVVKTIVSKPIKGAPTTFARAKMDAPTKSPLLRRPVAPTGTKLPVPPSGPTSPETTEPKNQMDWKELSGLNLSEKIEYFRNKLRN